MSRWYYIHPTSGGQPFSEDPIIIHPILKASDTLFVTNGLAINKTFESGVDTIVIISRPWIVDKGDFLEASPSDSLIGTRFPDNEFISTYQWFSNDVLVEGATSRTFQKSSAEKYHVRVIREGCSSTSNEFTPFAENLVLGLSDNLEKDIITYPNPVNDKLTIKGLTYIEGPFSLSVIDLRGTPVFDDIINKEDFNHYDLDVSTLLPGVYMLRILSQKKQVLKRFVKQ